MTDKTLEELIAEAAAADTDLATVGHAEDQQAVHRASARILRQESARAALRAFLAPETQPEQSAPVAAPEPDWPIGTYEAVPGSLVYNQAEARLNDDTPFEGCEPSAEDRAAESFRRVWAVKAEPDEQPDTEPDHIPRNGAAE